MKFLLLCLFSALWAKNLKSKRFSDRDDYFYGELDYPDYVLYYDPKTAEAYDDLVYVFPGDDGSENGQQMARIFGSSHWSQGARDELNNNFK